MFDDPVYWQHIQWFLGRPETWWLLIKITAFFTIVVWGLVALARRSQWLGFGATMLGTAGFVWLVVTAFQVQVAINTARMWGRDEGLDPAIWPSLVIVTAHLLGMLALVAIVVQGLRLLARRGKSDPA